MAKHRIHMVAIGVVVVGLALAAGCSAFNGPQGTHDVEGVVQDANFEEPVSEASVILGDDEATSDDSGEFEFEDVPAGSHVVTVSREGYVESKTTITVPSDDPVEVEILNGKFYAPNETYLGATHLSNSTPCSSCHMNRSSQVSQPGAINETCVRCHPTDVVNNSTAQYKHNPHDDPHGYSTECFMCHKVHQPSVNTCENCHEKNWTADPP